MAALVIGQVITQRTTGCAPHAGADGRAGGAAQAIANQRTACRAQTAANRRFGLVALLRPHRTPGGAPHAGADGRTGRATKLTSRSYEHTPHTLSECYGTHAVAHRMGPAQ